MGNNKPDDEKTDLFLSLLSLSWRWHARRARSHGNSTWCTLCVTRHRKGCVAALFHSKQRKHPYQDCYQKITYWSFFIAVLKSWWGMCFSCLSGGSHQYSTGPYSEATIQSSENPMNIRLLLYKPKWHLISLDKAVLHWANALTFWWNEHF